MNEEAFKKGFIKRASEYGLSDKQAEELIKEAFAPLVPFVAGAARFAAPRVLPWLGRAFKGLAGFGRRMWSGNVGTAAQPMYNLGANGAAKLGLKGMLNSPTAKGIGYGMVGSEAINQFSGSPQPEPQQLGPQQEPPTSVQSPGNSWQWTNPYTSRIHRVTGENYLGVQ